MSDEDVSLLKGKRFVAVYVGGFAYDPLDPTRPYRSTDAKAIRAFMDYLAARRPLPQYGGRGDDMGSAIVLVTADGKEVQFVVSAFPDEHNP